MKPRFKWPSQFVRWYRYFCRAFLATKQPMMAQMISMRKPTRRMITKQVWLSDKASFASSRHPSSNALFMVQTSVAPSASLFEMSPLLSSLVLELSSPDFSSFLSSPSLSSSFLQQELGRGVDSFQLDGPSNLKQCHIIKASEIVLLIL